MTADRYAGSELELFAGAVNWKRYALGCLKPYARGRVLEVGAGIGANVPHLISRDVTEWVCLEPDASLVRIVPPRDARVRDRVGTTEQLPENAPFDAVLYIDVLEHIEDDRGELARAARLLRQGGHLIVLAPAYLWLYSPFDAAIGHFRRYTRRTLTQAAPAGLQLLRAYYLDSAGLLASSANRLLLRQSLPTFRQIGVWDRVLVPISRVLDRVLRHAVGKTVVAVWRKS